MYLTTCELFLDYVRMAKKKVYRIRDYSKIVDDFDKFIKYLTENICELSPKNEHFSFKVLCELNKQMYYKSLNLTPKSPQNFYVLINLFYKIAVVSGLFQKTSKTLSGSKIIFKPTEKLDAYRRLTYTEKYFFLLETFWVDIEWTSLRSDTQLFAIAAAQIMAYISQGEAGKNLMEHDLLEKELNLSMYSGIFVEIFYHFGLVEYQTLYHKESVGRKHVNLFNFVTPTNFGSAIGSVLHKKRSFLAWNIPFKSSLEHKANIVPGSLTGGDYSLIELQLLAEYSGRPEEFYKAFTHLFSNGELAKTIPRTKKEFKDGTYVFRVSLESKIWRNIKCSANHTMEEFHESIQDAFNFDNDHLYSFYMNKNRWDYKSEITTPGFNEGVLSADAVLVGNLDIYMGKKFLYIFDFGDSWEFEVRVLQISEEPCELKYPEIIESKGEAPEQYGDEEWD